MKMQIKTFKTIHPVPGMSIGAYWVGKSNISSIEMVEQGLLVRRERGGVETNPPCIFTWANIIWYEGEAIEEAPKKAPSRKKAAEED